MSFFENCIELSKIDMAQLQDAALPAVLVGNQINIYRVILNLVGNAIKFAPAGSVELSVVLGRQVDDENVFVKIIVKDTGIGIPKDKQAVNGLTFLEASQPVVEYTPSRLQVIDLQGCIAIIETEARAREMLSMVEQLLDSTFIPEITSAYQKDDEVELKKALHKFLGSLCYVSTPALKRALLELQAVLKENQEVREQAYQVFLEEVRQFKIAYSALKHWDAVKAFIYT
jgi:hypothetical protein